MSKMHRVNLTLALVAVMLASAALPGSAQQSSGSTESTAQDTSSDSTGSSGSGSSSAASDESSSDSSDTSLDSWWTKSSMSFDPIPEDWLFHLEGTLGYQRLSGNTDGKYYTASIELAIRKGKYTISNSYIYSKQDIDYGGDTGSVDLTELDAGLMLRRDLQSWLYLMIGTGYEIDDSYYINGRNIAFAGAGIIYEPSDSITLEAIAAGGWQETEYEYEDLLATESDTGWSTGGRCEWKASSWLTLEGTGQFWDLDERIGDDQERGSRYFYTIEATIPINTYLSFTLQHKVEYENNWLVRLTGVDKKDTTQTIGIKLSI